MRSAAVIDADVIIKLAKIEVLDKLFRIYKEIHIPSAVRRETRLRGPQRRRRDVVRFRKRAKDCNRVNQFVFSAMLDALQRADPTGSHKGEAEAIAQAERLEVRVMLTDDQEATRLAEERGLEVVSTMQLTVMIASAE